MTAALGTAALWCGLAASLVSALAWPRARPAALGARAGRVALGCAVLAVALQAAGLVGHAGHWGHGVPFSYTVTTLWSALEASLLLWLLALTGVAAAAGRRRRPGDRLQPLAMTAVMLVCAAFFAVGALAGPPAVPAAADGPGPGALLHLGSAALAVPFGHGVACLVTGRTETGTIRRWTLAAWVPLTAGIVLGAWWSYRVLGWGGSWEWDPDENGALMPWLLTTALLHAAPSRAMRPWVVPLALAAFPLVPLGMFLAASVGALPVTVLPVTALAGAALLGVLVAALAGARALLARREPRRPARPDPLLLLGCALLAVLAGTVLLGLLLPPAVELLRGERAAAGPPYFERTLVPGLLALLALTGAAARVRHPRGGTATGVWRGLAWPLAVGAGTVAALALTGPPPVMALAAFGLAAFVLAAVAGRLLARTGGEPIGLRRTGGLVAHAGIALAAVAVAASSGYAEEATARVWTGGSVPAGGYTVRLEAVERDAHAAATTTTAVVSAAREGTIVDVLRPSLTSYPAIGGPPVARPAVRSALLHDLYVSVTDVGQDGRTAVLRVAVNPFMSLLWASGAIIALGGLLALLGGRGRPRTPPPGPASVPRPRRAAAM
ncbi:Cytochrome c-type biogenesis protein CcmF [Nonomuraea coxensis DSM 45129]|uniref:Cytochrome c-type biogenesis protein CcmF n=1 Tax=Nonomuraea coxensis DSM 45129 TaxID=1122611 RepID=A0ABX8U3Y5_9ACTN|nr:cytochrome c-type biogenesis CcmF C-terminal domain-containing protein [Nonomuraea coxensis]QYC42379.1 Cytochrome c-type biogenesis protein CcmF [Nonomuraea coxensis DSM 45129]